MGAILPPQTPPIYNNDKDLFIKVQQETSDLMSRKTTADFAHMDSSKPVVGLNDQINRLQCQASFILGNEQLVASPEKEDDFFIDEFLSNPIQVRV